VLKVASLCDGHLICGKKKETRLILTRQRTPWFDKTEMFVFPINNRSSEMSTYDHLFAFLL
jgi:hypothetical protein